MFSFLRGTIVQVDGQAVVCEVQGIGYALLVAENYLFIQGSQMLVYTYMHWNQESGPQIFGFANTQERQLFILIISCSGIGPKMALSLLSIFTPEALVTAITLGDIKALSSVNGIGIKKAETLYLHLKDKIAKLLKQGFAVENSVANTYLKELSEVLLSLGYSRIEVKHALDGLRERFIDPKVRFDELLRGALSILAKKI